MAFEFPDAFGSVGVFSGGIAAGEKDTFDAWITHTPKSIGRGCSWT